MEDTEFFDRYLKLRRSLITDERISETVIGVQQNAFNKTEALISSIKHTPKLSPFVSWHLATYLYWLGRELYIANNRQEATNTFLINKAVNAIELFYETEFKDFFLIGHGIGSVFTQAIYGNYFVFLQNVTVGRYKENRPTLEDYVIMYAGAMVIGRCHIKKNTVISAGTKILGKDTPGDCIAFEGKSGTLKFKSLNSIPALDFFIK